MKLIARAYNIDDYDIDMIAEAVIGVIYENLDTQHGIFFEALEKDSRMALVTEVFERLKRDIE